MKSDDKETGTVPSERVPERDGTGPGLLQEDLTVDAMLRAFTAMGVVLAILMLFPYTQDPANLVKFLVLHWTVAVMALVWCYAVWTGKKAIPRPSLLAAFLLAFLVVNLVSALASDHVANSLHELRKYIVLALLFAFAASAYHTPKQAWRLMGVIAVAVALSSVYGFCQRAGLDPFPWANTDVEEYRGLPATFGNPNMASHTLNLAVIMALALTLQKGARWCALPAGLIIIHIVLTEVRAAKVALVAAVVLTVVALIVRRRAKRPLCAALATFLIVAMLGVGGMGAVAGVAKWRTGSFFPLDRSLLLRYHSFYGASQMILDRPVLGYGPGNYRIDNPRYWTKYERDRFAVKPLMNFQVHNDYLQAAVEGGLAGSALYIGLLVTALIYSLVMGFGGKDEDRRRLGLTLAACFCAFAVDGLFGFNVHVPASASLLFVLAGVLMGVLRGPTAPAPRPQSKWAYAVSLSVLVFAWVLFYCDARVFIAKFQFQRGRGAKHYERYDEAYQFLVKGERLAPWDFDFPRAMAMVALKQRDPQRAVERMQRSLELNPYDCRGLAILASAYTNCAVAVKTHGGDTAAFTQALDSAGASARDALELCPALPEGHELLGRVALLRARELSQNADTRTQAAEEWQRVKTHLNDALKYGARDWAKVNTMLGTAHAALNELDLGERAFRRAVEAEPTSPDVWKLFMWFAQECGRWDGLIDTLTTTLHRLEQNNKADTQTRATMALWLAQALVQGPGEETRAQQVLARALEIAPTRLDVWGAYAHVLGDEDRVQVLSAALNDVNAQLASGREAFPRVLTSLAAALKDGDTAALDAATVLREASQEAAGKTDAETLRRQFGWIGDLIVYRLGQGRVPKEQYGRALHDVGFVYLVMEAWEQANQTLQQAAAFLPPDRKPYCELQRTEALLRLGRHDEAVALARDVAQALPGLLQARHQLARVLGQTGHTAAAKSEYTFLLNNFELDAPTRQRFQAERDALTQDANVRPPERSPGNES